ncbi:MAG TPA: hypothetical protein VMJ12_09210 [Candidatus Acidoferrales bacterium]|nr:hypothetical protein [Candidatus Acidoferrales bacterium]
MKRTVGLLVGIAIGIVVGILIFASRKAGPAASPEKTEQENAAVSAALANQNTNTVAIIQSNFDRVEPRAEASSGTAAAMAIPPAGEAQPLEVTNVPPDAAVQNMSRAIHQYGEMFGGNPVGTNPEFTKQLSGDNPKHINFISSEAGMRVNDNGELVDPWGTPYFFHQISGADTEIRSAGPDKVMYTSDDIVKEAQ